MNAKMLITILLLPAPLAAAEEPAVFEPVARVAVPDQPVWVVSQQAVVPRWEVLDDARPGDRLLLNLTPETSVIGVVSSVNRRGPQRYSLAADIEGMAYGSFRLVREMEAIAVDFRAPPQGLLGDAIFLADGLHLIRRMDEEKRPLDRLVHPEGEPNTSEPPPREAEAFGRPAEERNLDPPGARDTCWPLQPVVDIMIVYTDDARADAGGTSAIVARCHLAVDRTNDAFDNSDIDLRMRLVFCDEEAYDESGTMSEHLDELTDVSDGVLDVVHDLRFGHKADLVSLFVEDADCSGGTCTFGVGWCQDNYSRAFTVVNWEWSTTGLTLAHEVGHNFNCDHDHASAHGWPCADDDYSYGHRFTGNDAFQYRTIMAYEPGNKITYFSNPYIDFQGQPTGVPVGEDDAAYNALTIWDRRAQVEDYLLTRFDIWVDFDAPGWYQYGNYYYPYLTLAQAVSEIDNGFNANETPTLWIMSGTTDEALTINKAMTLVPCDGPVTIGVQ